MLSAGVGSMSIGDPSKSNYIGSGGFIKDLSSATNSSVAYAYNAELKHSDWILLVMSQTLVT